MEMMVMEKAEYMEIKNPIEVTYRATVKGWEMDGMHYHFAYELFFLEEGTRTYIINDKIYDISAGDVILIKPNVLHKTQSKESFKRYVINFNEEYILRFATEELKNHLLKCFDETNAISLSKELFLEVLENIKSAGNSEDEIYQFICLCNILNILSNNTSNFVLKNISIKNSEMQQILDYINENFVKIDGLEEISEKFYITKYHLCRIFKESAGISVIKYINGLKIQKACNLLDKTELAVTEIAFECGYNSSMYFCKIFKQLTGVSPLKYRNREY